MKARRITLLALLVVTPFVAFAHGAKVGPNGGQVQEAGPYHFELVVGDRDLSVYVTDASAKPVATKGAKATAIVLTNKKPVRITLSPVGTNELKGRGSFVSGSDLKLVFSLILPGKKPVMVRFASRK